MEDQQFDDMVRKLARPVSRRSVFRAVVATAVGGMASMFGFGQARAETPLQGKCIGKPCVLVGQYTNECCTGFCRPDRTCGCPAGSTECNGSCYAPCAGGTVLVPRADGTCTCACPGGTTACAGATAGLCCPAGLTCTGGICCPSNFVNVNGSCCPSAAACTNPNTGATTCCTQGNICSNGLCVSSCFLSAVEA